MPHYTCTATPAAESGRHEAEHLARIDAYLTARESAEIAQNYCPEDWDAYLTARAATRAVHGGSPATRLTEHQEELDLGDIKALHATAHGHPASDKMWAIQLNRMIAQFRYNYRHDPRIIPNHADLDPRIEVAR